MALPKKKSIWQSLFGDLDKISSEKYFVTLTALAASVFLFILCIIHIIMGLRLAPVFLAGSSSLVMLGLYLFLRFKPCLFVPKLILTVLGLVMLDFTWYAKFLSNGPVLFFILIFAVLVIWVWEGRSLLIVFIFYFLNLAVLGIIEANTPDILLDYNLPERRSLDIYLSFFLYTCLLVGLLYLVKKEFYRQKDKAIQSDKLKSAFLANMSHEIRTPMNAIVGFSKLLSKEKENANKSEYIGIIQNSSDRLLRLINDIIDLSIIDSDSLKINKSDFSIMELFEELQRIHENELIKKGRSDLTLKFICSEDTIIHSDPLRIQQILSNFINNSIKFTKSGSITFSCEKKHNELIFKVSDTGIGIPPEDQGKLFEQFTKFDYNGLNTEGSGIGLALAQKLATLLGGKIWLHSQPGKGSDFFLSIPYSPPKASLFKNNSVTRTKAKINGQKNGSILVVEDDKMSTKLIEKILTNIGVEATYVDNGIDARKFIKENQDISLVFMDIKLPGMDGYDLVKEIKQMNPDIYTVAQTAFAMKGDKEKALEAGFDAYLAKPLNSEKLLDIVNEHF